MKLTKEQILKIYASFDVKIIWNESKAIYGIHYNDEIDFVNDLYPISTLIHSLRCDDGQDWKYILRPLSSLTIEQEINGERFVPIVEMIRHCHFCGDLELKYGGETLQSKTTRREYIVGYNNFKIQWEINFGYIPGLRFDYVQWLLQHHFNVFNLPEDEYVDINSLNK